MFRGILDGLRGWVGSFGFTKRAAEKRRLEEDESDVFCSKIRPVEGLSASGSRVRMMQSNSFKVHDGPTSSSNTIQITEWEHDGKENVGRPQRHKYHPLMNNSSSAKREKIFAPCYNEVQFLGQTVFDPSLRRLKEISQTSPKCVADSEISVCISKGDMDPDIEIIHEDLKQNNYSSTRKNLKKNSPSQFGGTFHPHRSTNKDLNTSTREIASSKTNSISRRKSSFSNQCNQNPHAEVQVLRSSNRIFNNIDSTLKPQASLLSIDSSSSRSRSMLDHERRVGSVSKFNEMIRRVATVQGPRDSSYLSSLDGSKFSDDDIHCLEDVKEVRKFTPNAFPSKMNVLSPTKQERLSVLVDKRLESQPSTSAVRRQDDEIKIVRESQVVRKTGPEVLSHLNNIIQEYTEKHKLMQSLAAEKHKEAQQLCELNRQAQLERQRRRENDISERLKKYMIITEEEFKVEAEVPSALPVLTQEIEREIDAALRAPENKPLVDAFSITIKGRDMHTLRPLAWLNDEIINFYMNLLIERGKNDNYPSVYAFNTFFYPKLMSTGFSSLKRWTRKVDVFDHDFLVVPIHLGMHWCVSIINMKEQQVRYYDSLGGQNQQCLNALLKYLQDEHMDKKKKQYDVSGWTKECARDIPQQMNGSDCGMFSCMYAEYVTRRAPITFSQDDMPYFRRKMVYEILHKKLLC